MKKSIKAIYKGALTALFSSSPEPESKRAKSPSPSADYVLTQSEAFEAWLRQKCNERGLPMLRVLGLLQANSKRLESELHWMNMEKEARPDSSAFQCPHCGTTNQRHAYGCPQDTYLRETNAKFPNGRYPK